MLQEKNVSKESVSLNLFTDLNEETADSYTGGATWVRYPGKALDIIDGWAIGTNPVGGGNFGIYRWDGSKWIRMPGGAVSIGGNKYSPWVITSKGHVYRWE